MVRDLETQTKVQHVLPNLDEYPGTELVVRELEKDAALQARQTAIAAAGAEIEHYMRRTLACFDSRPVLFVDVRRGQDDEEPCWSMLHVNAAVSQVWKP